MAWKAFQIFKPRLGSQFNLLIGSSRKLLVYYVRKCSINTLVLHITSTSHIYQILTNYNINSQLFSLDVQYFCANLRSKNCVKIPQERRSSGINNHFRLEFQEKVCGKQNMNIFSRVLDQKSTCAALA